MFQYLLGGMEDAEREELRKKVFDSRRNTLEGETPEKATDYDGKSVEFRDFELPDRW